MSVNKATTHRPQIWRGRMTTGTLTATYLFFRAEGFYPVHDIPKYDLAEHIRLNPGTLKVEEYKNNGKHKVVWTLADGWLDSEE